METQLSPSRRLLPQGVSDLIFEAAAERRALEAALRDLFIRWGYSEIIPPTFAYADTLSTQAGPEIEAEMYRFLDRDGSTLALRPDLTIPTARAVGTRLADQPMPLRLCYTGSVFRYGQPRAGQGREFAQAGMELIGAATADADAELLALTIEALRTAGLEAFQITLGQMAYFHGLLAELQPLNVSDEDIMALRLAVDRKSEPELRDLLARLPLPTAIREALTTLPALSGRRGVLDRAEAVALNDTMQAAVENLRMVEQLLHAYHVTEHISLDLTEVRGMDYYTGITFEGHAPGSGYAICSGWRYDNLIGHFGADLPAVGCALVIDRILLVRERQGRQPTMPTPHIIVNVGDCSTCLEWVQIARSLGVRVEVDVLKRDTPDLLAYAQARGIPRIAVHSDDGTLHLVDEAGERPLTVETWAQEAARWIR
ncbi:MAG TPA: ATP phosphoribosyltransferase regulatory subunit [Anaerolineae bacterium]|nr:ATP phosphoribosyltransferase regulatory subunit [Anaerolineae bacterium]